MKAWAANPGKHRRMAGVVPFTMNRRRFLLQSTATAAASTLGFPAVVRCASPNSMLQVASIGVARMGGATMRGVGSHAKVKIVAPAM